MCWTAIVGGKPCTDMGELRKAIYPNKIAINPLWNDPRTGMPASGVTQEHSCLCPVDFEKTAEAAGMTAVRDPTGDWYVTLEKGEGNAS